MEYRVITNTGEFESLKTEWERIQANDLSLSYFSTFEYCYTWWSVYQKDSSYKLFIIVIYQNESIIGIAPLLLQIKKKRFITWKRLQFLAQSDYHDFLIDCSSNVKPLNVIKRIFSVIEKHEKVWDEIDFTHISQHSLLTEYILKSKYNKHYYYLIENPVVDFTKYNSFDNYCARHLPANVKNEANRLYRETKYKLEITSENKVETISSIHIAEQRYLQKQGRTDRSSLFEDTLRFQVIDNLHTKSRHSLTYFLVDTINKKTINYNIGFLHNNVFYYTNTAYHPNYINFSAGKVLIYEMVKDAFQNNRMGKIDFGCGRYPWKFEWTNKFNLLYRLYYRNLGSRKLKMLWKLKDIRNTLKNCRG
jgi:hypothetical protein